MRCCSITQSDTDPPGHLVKCKVMQAVCISRHKKFDMEACLKRWSLLTGYFASNHCCSNSSNKNDSIIIPLYSTTAATSTNGVICVSIVNNNVVEDRRPFPH